MTVRTIFLLSVCAACLSVFCASPVHAGSELSVTKDENKTEYSIKSTGGGAGENGNGNTYNLSGTPTGRGKQHGHHKNQRGGKAGQSRKPYQGQPQGQPPVPPHSPPEKPMGDEQQEQPPTSGGQVHL